MIPHSYTNWMGYEIHVGDTVFYSTGGSYPHFRVGQVLDFKESGGYGAKEILARVHWLAERGYQHKDPSKPKYIPFSVDKKSTVNAEVLCPVDDFLLGQIGHYKHTLDNAVKSVVP
jgi:hypothetical protein